jgi:hypothetical protein
MIRSQPSATLFSYIHTHIYIRTHSYRPPTDAPSSSPDLTSYPESRAYLLTWAWGQGGALTREEADTLRVAVEVGVEGALGGKGVVRRGKGGFGVRDVTWGGWGGGGE